jgi:hypothetical protein
LIDTSSYNSPLCLLQNCEHLSSKVKSTFSSTNSFLIIDGKNTSARGLSLLEQKTIECNTKEQIRNCFMEIKNIAFEKLNDLEFKNTIQVHDLVWQSGVPNYLGCRIPCPFVI